MIWLFLYLPSVLIVTVALMVEDGNTEKDKAVYMAAALFWPLLLFIGVFVGLFNVLSKVADSIIKWKSEH